MDLKSSLDDHDCQAAENDSYEFFENYGRELLRDF
jgi:hypothetical protein